MPPLSFSWFFFLIFRINFVSKIKRFKIYKWRFSLANYKTDFKYIKLIKTVYHASSFIYIFMQFVYSSLSLKISICRRKACLKAYFYFIFCFSFILRPLQIRTGFSLRNVFELDWFKCNKNFVYEFIYSGCAQLFDR